MNSLEWYLQSLQSLQIQQLHDLETHGAATFVDTANAFMPDKAPWMLDQIHPNPAGSAKFAALVASALAASRLAPTVRSR